MSSPRCILLRIRCPEPNSGSPAIVPRGENEDPYLPKVGISQLRFSNSNPKLANSNLDLADSNLVLT